MAAAAQFRPRRGEESTGAVSASPRLKRAAINGLELRPAAVHRPRAAFYRNFGVLVRALAYIMAHGGDGLSAPTSTLC
jgi:glycine cleavage system protein P-like pyridoxal-binding family